MGFRFGRAAAVAAGVAMIAGAALAHEHMGDVPDTPAAKAVVARHQSFKQLGGAFKAIFDELKKDAPDKAVIRANAQKMNALAGQEASWFPKGTGPEAGVKTDAKPEIWSDPKGFAAAVQKLQTETAKLQQVSVGGDVAAIKAQVQATGGACKGCHDKFRVPDKD
ncbi:MAG TPA: cytochrome c [Phenylobacterium sp.]|uniref:c-type cytochrome n=1 Tax=Phenylobacterium sp. TaxID=1871053 RepID=UPI002B4A5EB1|nr:cytochrome c [Phenylobacterium sp.]HKR87510.1 cytochrome c [Phenylobacterium sp.]